MGGRLHDAPLHAWYEAASIFVHPTRYEGSSIVTLEAMSHRRPVVATTAGGLPDKVRTAKRAGSCLRATRRRSRAPCGQPLVRGRPSLQWAPRAGPWSRPSSRGTARPTACWPYSRNCSGKRGAREWSTETWERGRRPARSRWRWPS
ncbi:MAG: glycosyltransferase family 4 protein [Ignavibacteriales bacterium]|nr:glycosyltransferase family 4 protein [Ignavibacteriales bacterium]